MKKKRSLSLLLLGQGRSDKENRVGEVVEARRRIEYCRSWARQRKRKEGPGARSRSHALENPYSGRGSRRRGQRPAAATSVQSFLQAFLVLVVVTKGDFRLLSNSLSHLPRLCLGVADKERSTGRK